MSLKRFVGIFFNFIFSTNSAIWFEKDLTEKLVEYQPKIPIEIDMNSTSHTIAWVKNQKEKWLTNPKELASAEKYNHCWLSISTNGNIIGCLKIGFNNPYITDYKRVIEMPEKMAFIYDTFVIPEYRNKGVNTYVSTQVLKFLKEQGYNKVGVHVPSWNIASLRTLEKMGFKKVIYIKCFRIFNFPILIGKSAPRFSTFKTGKLLKVNAIYEQTNKPLNNINISEYTIYKIETLEKLSEIKSDWERLFNSNLETPLLFAFEIFKIYYETIIKNFKNVKIEIYVIKNKSSKIIAIFPFTLDIKKYMGFLPLRELSIKDYFLIGFFNFLIDSEENPEIIFKIFLKYLKQCKKNWDFIRIYSNNEEYELIKIFKSLAKKQYKIDENGGNTLVINCNRDFEDYVKNDIDGKDLRELKRKSRRLDEQGLVTVVEMKEPEEIKEGLLRFYDIEDSGWKGAQETSLKSSYYGEFYKKLAMYLSMENKLRLYFLKLNDEYIAGIYAIIDRDIIYLIKIGYLNAFYKYSPSNVLFYLVFKKLFAEKKISKIDFYGPYTRYQKVFGKNTRKRSDVNLCNKKIIPTLYYVIARILRRTSYPFKKDSIPGKIFNTIEKQFK